MKFLFILAKVQPKNTTTTTKDPFLIVCLSKTTTHQKDHHTLSQEAEAKALYRSCPVGRQEGFHLGYQASEPGEGG